VAADGHHGRVVSSVVLDPATAAVPAARNSLPVAVLIVDDDPSKRLGLKAILQPLGCTTIEASSGEEALRRVMEQDFAVILLDVRMPGMDGFQTAAFIRKRRESEMTPIIFITSYSDDELGPYAGYVEGAVDFIFAPVSPHELRAKVTFFANLFLKAAALASQSLAVQAAADRLRLLTDTTPVGIFETDVQGRFVYTNARWSEITGISSEQATGVDWDTIAAAEENAGVFVELDEGSHPTRSKRRIGIRTPGATPRVILSTWEPILGPDGDQTGSVGTLADITVSAGVDEERLRFRSLVQNSRDVIAVIDEAGVCTYISPAVTHISGYTPEELVGRSGFEFIHPDDLGSVTDHLSSITGAPNEIKTVEVRTRTKTGEWIWIEIRASNMLADASIQGIVLNFHDITERRVAADRIAASEHSLGEAQAISHFGSYELDLVAESLDWSDEQYRLLGFEPGTVEPSLKILTDAIHVDDRDEFSTMIEACVSTGAPFELDFRILRPDGATRWIHGKGETTIENGTAVRLTGMSHDITSRKEAEEERAGMVEKQRELTDQLRLLLDSTGEGIFGVDRDGVCTFINRAAASLLGGTPDRFIGSQMHTLTHHSYADGSTYQIEDCAIFDAFRTGMGSSVVDEVFWTLDGTSFPVEYSSHPMSDRGQLQGAVVAFKDVTLRHQMETDLRDSEQLFRGAFDASRAGIALIGADGKTYVDVNHAMCELLGYSKAELLSLDWIEVTHPDDRQENIEEVARLSQGTDEVSYVSKRYVRKDGEVIFVEISDSVVRDEGGVPLYFVTHATDVTDRERLQAQLGQAQKMEAVGLLAGGVAHDFNNILAVILNYAEFVSEDLEADDTRLADVREIIKAGEKASQLVHQLLSFSRKEVVEPRVIDLNEVIADLHGLLRRSLREDIELVFDAGSDLPHIDADPGRIEQVLLNLAVNGRDAMPEGGVLTIATDKEVLGAGARAGLPGGVYARLTVRDIGQGIDEATAARVFEPFFTTKPRGEGTGLGLATVYGIVKQAQGGVYVDSEEGIGTIFSVYFPMAAGIVTETKDETVPLSVGGTETILLVEDEEAVRVLVSRILTKHGYEVLSFSSGLDAMELYQDNIEGVDLLLTDVVMPNMSGKALSEHATLLNADVKTLFMSGYTDELIAQRGILEAGENLIKKPFRADQLLSKVRSLLDAGDLPHAS
jgi:PAS domain S-box-containing protein